MAKKNALDGLLGKLDSQLNAEKSNRKGKKDPLGLAGVVAGIGASVGIGAVVSNPQVSNPQVSNPQMNPSLRSVVGSPFDPSLSVGGTPTGRTAVRNARKAKSSTLRRQAILRRQQVALARHRDGTQPDLEDQDEDLKENLDFIDENKFKTMEWTEPDGSKTTLKFDEDGTLIGKETTKSRPDKFSKDLKKAVDRNAVALKDYEDSLMSDPVT